MHTAAKLRSSNILGCLFRGFNQRFLWCPGCLLCSKAVQPAGVFIILCLSCVVV